MTWFKLIKINWFSVLIRENVLFFSFSIVHFLCEHFFPTHAILSDSCTSYDCFWVLLLIRSQSGTFPFFPLFIFLFSFLSFFVNCNFRQLDTLRHFFRNLIKSTRNQIVFTIFRLIWIQMDARLNPNQSKNCEYNLIWVDLTRIISWFLRV